MGSRGQDANIVVWDVVVKKKKLVEGQLSVRQMMGRV